ncbi:MAG: ComF family protein [bacterium]|nr:ComF family protein [bacterium]
MYKIHKTTKEWLLDLLFPKFCVGCETEGLFLCETCKTGLLTRTLTPVCPVCSFRNGTGAVCKPCRKKTALSRLVAVFPYQEKAARELLHIYKYNRVREMGPMLTEFLTAHVQNWRVPFSRTMIVVPIPLHRARRRERGFNQSEEIGKQFAEAVGLLYRDDVLERTSYTQSQVECADFRERRKNISGVFSAREAPEIRHKTIMLVDDIATSRSTMDEAARVLKEAGVKSVWGVVIARG